MRPGRVVVLAALPVLLALGGLNRPGALAPAADAASLPVRVVTDGHPLPVVPVVAPRPAPATRGGRQAPPAPAPRRTGARPAPRVATAVVVDGYPWAHDATGSSDPWGFTKRQCVSYVAWRLAQRGRPLDARDGWGSALTWAQVARRLGERVTTTPVVGAVAQWDAGEASPWWSDGGVGTFTAGPYGHVALVLRVLADGSVLVAQYNGTLDRAFSTMRVRAPRYLLL